MKKALMFLGALLLPAIAYAQKQTPLTFWEDVVVVGSHKLQTRILVATGFWSDADAAFPANSVEIHCYQRFSFCEDAERLVDGGVVLQSYDILRWDSRELIAVDSSAICVVNTLRFDLVAKRVSSSSVQKTDSLATRDPFCKDVVIPTAFLGGLEDKINQQAAGKAK